MSYRHEHERDALEGEVGADRHRRPGSGRRLLQFRPGRQDEQPAAAVTDQHPLPAARLLQRLRRLLSACACVLPPEAKLPAVPSRSGREILAALAQESAAASRLLNA